MSTWIHLDHGIVRRVIVKMERLRIFLITLDGVPRPKPAGVGVEVNPLTCFHCAGAREDAGVERVTRQQRQAKQRSDAQLNHWPHAAILDSVSRPRKARIPVSTAVAFRTGKASMPAFSWDQGGWRDDIFRGPP